MPDAISQPYINRQPFCWRNAGRRRICAASARRGLIMIDEHFSRDWNATHVAFSADLDRAITALDRTVSNGVRRLRDIANAYAHPALHGLAAVISTFVLFVTVGMIAFPQPLHA